LTDLDQLRARLTAEGALTLDVKVIPKSPANQFAGRMADGAWKVRVAAAPEKGRANAELCRFLAREFAVPQKHVTLVAGETSHHKTLRIVGR
jgi:uncharacterized protein (TIGR00251 family)